MQIATGVFIDREEREVFFVVPELRAELGGDWRPVLLVTAISRQGVLMLWPIPLPDEGGRRNAWAEAAREAAETGKQKWVRVVADMALGVIVSIWRKAISPTRYGRQRPWLNC